MMTNKKICFFGDTNKVMTLDLATEKWSIKILNRSSNEFLYYAAAVTLPNGDALVTGGGSSTTVYQYLTSKEELVQKRSMNQMRKEHAAVINEHLVYVMGGYDGVQNIFLNSCEVYNIQNNEWRYFAPMNISKCAFSATVVNKKYIYTFGGYDGQNRLEAIERFTIVDASWELLKVKLKFPLSNCACFCPEKNKVVLFGGGFSSGFSPYVEQIDVEACEWKALPIMAEGRDLRNKVVFADEHAFAVGGLNSKAEKFNFSKRNWTQLQDYPIADNLDSWACALTFIPKEYPIVRQATIPVASSSGSLPITGLKEEEEELKDLMEQEMIIDQEIIDDLERFRAERDEGFIEMVLEDGELRIGESGDGQVEANEITFNASRDTSMISATGASSQV